MKIFAYVLMSVVLFGGELDASVPSSPPAPVSHHPREPGRKVSF